MKRILSTILAIAMIFTMLPMIYAAEVDYQLRTGEAEYTGKVNETISVPVYFASTSDANAVTNLSMTNFEINTTAGLVANVVGGLVEEDAITVVNEEQLIIVFNQTKIDASGVAPLFTVEFTAAAAGTYDVEFAYPVFYTGDNSITSFEVVGTSITVTAPQKVLTGIAVDAPSVVSIPWGSDAVETVKAAITGVTAIYNDQSREPISNYDVKVEGNVATVTYEGHSWELAVKYEEEPVTDVEILVKVTSIEVPYGTDDAVIENYVIGQVGEVKVKNSKNEENVVQAQIAYNPSAGVVTVDYGTLPTVTIPVTIVTITEYSVGGFSGIIEIPFDCADPEKYVKDIIKVTGALSNGGTVNVTDFTVEVDTNWTEAIVKVDGQEIEVVDIKRGEEPPAEIIDIEILADAIVVPYGADKAATIDYIRSAIIVNTVDEDNVKTPVAKENLEIAVVGNKATVTYGKFNKDVDFTVETAVLVPGVETIEIPYTVDVADYAAYIAGNVTFTIDYSALTNDKPVVATASDVEIDVDVAVITIEGLVAEVHFTVQPTPEYIDTAVENAYGFTGKSLVKITGVAQGKVAYVNGTQATYFGNGVFAIITDAQYAVELQEVATMPEAAIFGKLHEAGVSAWDALVTNDKALQKNVDVFDDIQNYLLADYDGNGVIEASDALAINKISLYQTAGTLPEWIK